MAPETYAQDDKDSALLKGGWIGKFRSWALARCKKNERKQIIKGLLAYDERRLKDFGLSRSELVLELGHDPYALPEFYRWRAGVMPYF